MPTRTLTFTLSEFVRHKERLATDVFHKAAMRGALSGALRVVTVMHDATRAAPPASPNGQAGAVNTGRYLRAWRAEPTQYGARVTNSAPYAGVIEGGRRPGAKQPPTKVIAAWLQRRVGLARDEAKKRAFIVARAIARRGLAARRVMASRVDELTRILLEEVKRELDKVLGEP